MQGIFQKENTDKALKYGIYRHLPTYEKIIRNLVSFYATHLHKFFNLVIVLTLDFWYMIKTKEATESAALEFCHILNKFAAQLDECLSVKDYWVQ